MKLNLERGSRLLIMAAGLAVLAACAAAPRLAPRDTITQFSTIDALLAGAYDGQVTLRELRRQGNFGIGTFEGLDGEMVVLDGEVYQVGADGAIRRPGDSQTTPFASVVHFEEERAMDVPPGTDFEALQGIIDGSVGDPNVFCAVKMHGRFRTMHTRSVPAQRKPYPPLVEVTRNQPEFQLREVSGTIVGFRCPAYVKGINVPGYHLHFLADDRASGGHILNFEVIEATAQFDRCHRLNLVLPEGGALRDLDLTRDRSQELHEAEQ